MKSIDDMMEIKKFAKLNFLHVSLHVKSKPGKLSNYERRRTHIENLISHGPGHRRLEDTCQISENSMMS